MYALILSTTNELECAKDIAHALIEKKYAACVNIVPNITSIYSWEGEIVEDGEYLLIIKTHPRLFNKISTLIKNINTYGTPEVIMFGIKKGDDKYIKWLESCLVSCEIQENTKKG